MAVGLDNVLEGIRKLAAAEGVGRLSDRQLLERFAADRHQGCFAALVHRHGAMVLNVCRRVLRNAADAEDASQAAFLLLARKAASIRKTSSVGSWLHGVAYRVATNLRREIARRRAREERPRRGPANASADMTWREVQTILDEEIERLPEKFKAPVLLCYLEGKTHNEGAQQLGWTLTTFRGRLERARELLRRGVTRRGITLSGALLGTLVCANGASAALPAKLAASAVKTGMLAAAGKAITAGAVSARILALSEGLMKGAGLTKLKVAAVALLVLGVAGIGAGFIDFGAAAEDPGPKARPPAVAAQPAVNPASQPKPEDVGEPAKKLDVNDVLAEALEAVKGIKGYKGFLLASIAETQAKAGNKAAAGKTFAEVFQILESSASSGSPYSKSIGLARLGRIRFLAGDRPAGRKMLQEALALARTVSKENERTDSLRLIAWVQAELGEIEAARTAAQHIKPDRSREHVLADIVIAQAKAGDVKGALHNLEGLSLYARATAWLALAEVDAAKDRAGAVLFLAKARDAVDRLEEVDKPSLLRQIALLQAELQDEESARKTLDAAHAVARRVNQGFNKDWFLAPLAIARAKAGDRAGAKRLLEEAVKTVENEDQFSRSIVNAHIALGDFRAAYRKIHQAYGNEQLRADSLRDLAEAQAEAGDAPGAYAWARAESEPLLKACALRGVAGGMLKSKAEGRSAAKPVSAPTAEDIRNRPPLRPDHSGEYYALMREHERAIEKFSAALQKAKTREERDKLRENAPAQSLAGRILELAQKYKDEPFVAEALEWILMFSRDGPEAQKAMELVLADHVASPRLGRVIPWLLHSRHQKQAEKVLRAVLEKNPDRRMQGQACLVLGKLLHDRAGRMRHLAESADPQMIKFYEEAFGKELAQEFRTGKPEQAEAEKYFERVLRDYADIKAEEKLLAESAKAALFEIRDLAPGRTAPEIESEDIDGKRFKLSDYRGKVVVLLFWGDW